MFYYPLRIDYWISISYTATGGPALQSFKLDCHNFKEGPGNFYRLDILVNISLTFYDKFEEYFIFFFGKKPL